MNLETVESLLIVLLFFLPGFVFTVVRSQFRLHTWKNTEFQLLTFIFSSLIFQYVTLFLLSNFFYINIVQMWGGNSKTELSLISQNFNIISAHIGISVVIAIVSALIISLKSIKRFWSFVKHKIRIEKIYEMGLENTHPIYGIFEQKTQLGSRYIGCVVQTDDDTLYDGNIFHYGFGDNTEDYVIVLKHVTRLKNGQKKKLPDDMEVLLPYSKIKNILYKTYPVEDQKNNSNQKKINWWKINVSLYIIILALILLSLIQINFIIFRLI